MVASKLPEKEFIELYRTKGPKAIHDKTGVSLTNIHLRRKRIEERLGIAVLAPDVERSRIARRGAVRSNISVEQRHTIENGHVLVGSDAHYWPNYVSPSHRAFVKFCEELKPKLIVKNGDALDGASVSRHPPIGWESLPTLEEEMEAVKERLGEIEDAAPNAAKDWPLGNHDARFEMRLAAVAPEYAKIHGFHLQDHFPLWKPCWSSWVNGDVCIKHRFKGGIHATRNNTLNAGVTMVTGHLHSLKVTPFSDYTGTRFGVDCGTMADPQGPQFNYAEANPRDWRQGFVVLTFHKGRLLWPEVVHVLNENEVEFRGEVIDV